MYVKTRRMSLGTAKSSGRSRAWRLLATLATIAALAIRAQVANGQCPFAWQPGDGVPGTDGGVAAAVVWDPDGPGPLPPMLVVGGGFQLAGKILASNIAAWDGTSWQALG